jgi:hypothetical protein
MNLWKTFDRLIQTGGPRFIGAVTAVDGQRCTVTLLPSGVSVDVEGVGRSLAIGQRWIVQDGKIIDEAPAGDVSYLDI